MNVGGTRVGLLGPWTNKRLRHALHHGLYEVDELEILKRTLDPTDVYMEVGSGLGLVTATACRIIGDPTRVHAFDANPALADAARDTGLRNGFDISVTIGRLGDASDGSSTFYVEPDFWASSFSPSARAHPVEVTNLSVNEVFRDVEPSYLMLDIEGAEIELLDRALPASLRRITVEVHTAKRGALATSQMLARVIDQGFAFDPSSSTDDVWHLFRA